MLTQAAGNKTEVDRGDRRITEKATASLAQQLWDTRLSAEGDRGG